jgi:gamma-glutamylcyclotransferase (GGCT)/AIG2-like uncharacterized protein YtfP
MFFYGSLKRGHANHGLYCRGYLRAEEATVRGRLYDPALVVPQEDVRAVGTAEPLGDAAEQRHLGHEGANRPGGALVSGELLIFDDPEERLPALDRLEGFDPAGPSLYRRVLISARTSRGRDILAWAYVIEESSGTYLPGGSWPP